MKIGIPALLIYKHSIFLQKTISKNEETDIYFFERDHDFTNYPIAQVGDTWVFNEANNITAEIVGVGQESLGFDSKNTVRCCCIYVSTNKCEWDNVGSTFFMAILILTRKN